METKQDLRKRLLRLRKEMDDTRRNEADQQRTKRVLSMKRLWEADLILSYVSLSKEADTHEILRQLLAGHKRVAVPRVEGDTMRFFLIDSLLELEPGFRGILEPRDLDAKREVDLSLLTGQNVVVLVPGSAFDRGGGRIGYGGGYYDRLFAKLPDAYRLALAYDLQIVDQVPCEELDMPIHEIVTESQAVKLLLN